MAARLEQMLYRDDAMWIPHPIGMYRYVGATIHVRNRETPNVTDVFPMGGALERELVRKAADLLTARKDLTEYHRELRAEREEWESERAGYEGTLRAMDDVDASNRNEIRELKDLVVAQAKRLVELEGEA